MKILLVEDSRRLSDALRTAFRKEGYVIDCAADGEDGLWHGLNLPYDVIVLDIMLPGLDGLSILDRLRSSGIDAPVLLLTALDSVTDKLKGFRTGADDYLAKPFAVEELIERVRALARRRHPALGDLIEIDALVIDTRIRRVRFRDQLLDLTPKEYRLMELLARNVGSVLERAEIEHNIYDSMTEPSSNVVDVTIANLRRKLRRAGVPTMIHTRRGQGYYIDLCQ